MPAARPAVLLAWIGGATGQSFCPNPPCPASLEGDVGFTTIGGTDSRTSKVFVPGENIYGPFLENGLNGSSDGLLESLGCDPGSPAHVPRGIDAVTAEQL
eukprot:1381081-Prymnesium_polylepis.2